MPAAVQGPHCLTVRAGWRDRRAADASSTITETTVTETTGGDTVAGTIAVTIVIADMCKLQ